jgi:hypothetical protein
VGSWPKRRKEGGELGQEEEVGWEEKGKRIFSF